ncbi:LacI family DNA-binding transcriptional regulator [Phototrophicus methaneseepsis]|uniref:LacI family DNA-binding transcriptional regulator n=1 Tax=Phototrophicus methaneseepsis TaxID=2710758 RepID=A0A7S8E5Q0_9CHLR|nr:LacI family DNA-binding transcriptional regulator [Phototrophicus methaneseepsis]QPC80825.1 LacI family DNA-binding transcriptional regulator [Phototrophicus methaneseepsis]
MVYKITLADIAREAGVSKQTVSRVVNNNPDVAIATRKRVQAIIDRLDYQPNALAKSLSARQTHTIGLISSQLHDFGPLSMLLAIDKGAHDAGYRLLPYLVHDDHRSDVETHLRNLLARQPDAIIWEFSRTWVNAEFMENNSLLASIPIITMENKILGIPTVIDVLQKKAAINGIQHLLDEGYQNIGIIAGPPSWHLSMKRLEGWRACLHEHGLPAEDRQIAQGDWSADSGYQATAHLLETFPEMDAVFATNDKMAMGALNLLHERGIQIPQQMGVLGYDDMPEAKHMYPALTTLHQPFAQYGAAMVKAAVMMIEANIKQENIAPPEIVEFCPELIIRQSTRRRV